MKDKVADRVIDLTEKYSCYRDGTGWCLIEKHKSTIADKQGVYNWREKRSYYLKLEQVLRAIIDAESGECKSVTELFELLKLASKIPFQIIQIVEVKDE